MNKKLYLETYGCQMNMADSELVLSLLNEEGYTITENITDADVILVNTCGVREHAEQRIYGRLGKFKSIKNKNPDVVVGVLGCMAERLRSNLTTEKAKGVGQIVDLIVGPDEYRKLPDLVHKAWHGEKGIAVQLSRIETYNDISPLRTNGISAWISVMRGCDKFCSFCVVPFTRGRERSRPLVSIIQEVESLAKRGFKEITLLGQNVNSYQDRNNKFDHLLSAVASVDRTMRIRFTTSHPQDISDELIETIAEHKNICKYIHLPIQSASDRILELMNRNYDSKHYRYLIDKIRTAMPNVSISTDFIVGFPTEADEDHKKTLELIEEIRFDGAFMFQYSARENTPAYKMGDDVSNETKTRRINEIIDLQNRISAQINHSNIGKVVEVLVEGRSKKSASEWQGRNEGNKMVIFQKGEFKIGDYINLKINQTNSATLFGTIEQNKTKEVTLC
ncbi:MAG: tRNA (N6-isopentenyl adenosine(37)-C2)-methylthiotransferase MiaB [Bacteroidota bacterium]|nr:tRNA (N6-isopentenyl adenosine(37)-C2)-methylthiotransferase MiaB [Bacteroidota bacterium]